MMRFLTKTLTAMVLLGGMTPLCGDDPLEPFSWIATSESRDVMFKMVAPKWGRKGDEHVIVRKPFGVAYEIDDDGELKELWRTHGWYSHRVFLSHDGRYLVRMGPWPTDQEHHTDLAVAFYDRGVLLKEHRVCDLLKDADKAENSVSHYSWLPVVQGEKTGFKHEQRDPFSSEKEHPFMFHLVTIDKTAYRFEVATGKVYDTTVDSKAGSRSELDAEEQAACAKAGRALYVSSSFKKEYDDYFELAEVWASQTWNTGGVWFDGPEWHAKLKPRKPYALPCEIGAVFPFKDDNIEVSINASEIDEALQAVLAHPFAKRCIADKSVADVRMRVTGDRLHWDSEKLQGYMAKLLPGSPVTTEDLRPWAEVIFTSEEHNHTALFLNVKTGQVIGENKSEWPNLPFLLDATGVRVGK